MQIYRNNTKSCLNSFKKSNNNFIKKEIFKKNIELQLNKFKN
jgi:hypothetical protein